MLVGLRLGVILRSSHVLDLEARMALTRLRFAGSALLPLLSLQPASVLPAMADDVPTCFGMPATIVGTEHDDELVVTDGPDVIASLGGNDVVHPGGGDDLTCAWSGDDVVSERAGNDEVSGADGSDQLGGGV